MRHLSPESNAKLLHEHNRSTVFAYLHLERQIPLMQIATAMHLPVELVERAICVERKASLDERLQPVAEQLLRDIDRIRSPHPTPAHGERFAVLT